MARPVKYNWEAIREAYEGGLNREDICRKYRVSNKLLGNQIRTEGWVVNGSINADVDAFYAGAHKMAQNLENLHPDNQDLVIQKINTMEQDNELIGNNRKIAKLLQSVIVANRANINLGNIRNVSGVMVDIERIANPQNGAKVEINNTNAQQVNTQYVGFTEIDSAT